VLSKAWIYGRSLAGIVGSNPAGSIDFFLLWVLCASALVCSLIQRSPAECGVSECDRKTSIMRRPWSTRGFCAIGGPTARIKYNVFWGKTPSELVSGCHCFALPCYTYKNIIPQWNCVCIFQVPFCLWG
jgi:hypothetical protein